MLRHFYVSCYFYDTVENPLRKKLKDEFQERYPWCLVLEKHGKPGFVDYDILNEFISKINLDTLGSITLIDSDLVLPDDFRQKIEDHIARYDVLHNVKELVEIKDGVELYRMGAMTFFKQGFTGGSWSWSGDFIRSIKKFPSFKIGGFDFIMGLMFYKKYPRYHLEHILGGDRGLLRDFYNSALKYVDSFSCVNNTVYHMWHGDRHRRILDLSVYKEEMSEENIRYFMSIRDL